MFLLVLQFIFGLICLAVIVFFRVQIVAYLGKFNLKPLVGPVSRDDFLLAVTVVLCTGFFLYFFAKYIFDYYQTEIAVTDQRIIGRAPRLLVAFSLQPVDLPLSDLKRFTIPPGPVILRVRVAIAF